MKDDETTPLPPPANLLESALRHCGDGLFAQTSAIRDLERTVAKQNELLAAQSVRIDQLIASEQEERVTLLAVAQSLAVQDVLVKQIREDSAEHLLARPEDLEEKHGVRMLIGKAVVNVVTHRVFPWAAAAALGAWHAVRSWLHG
jgi:hypothetical protein